VVLDIVVPEEILVLRLASRRICSQCGANASIEPRKKCIRCSGALVTRTDDGAGIVRERLKVYQRQTKPLVDYYASRPTFRSVDGNLKPDAVTKAIEHAIREVVAAKGARA
jgi:adenylate kinase